MICENSENFEYRKLDSNIFSNAKTRLPQIFANLHFMKNQNLRNVLTGNIYTTVCLGIGQQNKQKP